jgi:hypothetical protein
VGPINVKAGDFYSTIGLGAWSKGEKSTDALSLSTKVGLCILIVSSKTSNHFGYTKLTNDI